MSEGCVFCDQSWMRAAEIFIETPHCLFASTRDPDIWARGGLAEGVLPGSGAIVPSPTGLRSSVFGLTPAEWADTRDLLLQARMAPRFDGPLSDRWLRSAREEFCAWCGKRRPQDNQWHNAPLVLKLP